MILLLLHGAEEHVGADGFRYEVGRVQHVAQRLCVVYRAKEQVLTGAQNANDIIDGLFIDRNARETGIADRAKNLFVRGVHGQGDDVGAVGHHVKGGMIVELEDVVDHLALGLGDGALFLTDIGHHANVLLGDLLALGVGVNAQQTQHRVGGDGQQPDQRTHHRGKGDDDGAYDPCHSVGLLHGHALGNQFAKDQRKIGKNNGNCDDTDGIEDSWIRSVERRNSLQPLNQRTGEIIRRKCRAKKARKRYGDLNGGEAAGRRGDQFEHPHGVLVAAFGLPAQLVFIQADDGDFRGGEKSVDGDEYDLQNQLPPYRVRRHRNSPFKKLSLQLYHIPMQK